MIHKMKILVVCMFLLSTTYGFAQQIGKVIPSVKLKTLDGNFINTDDFNNDGKPIILDFWATWCKPCVNELNAIQEVYADWVKETGVKVIAVSIDDARTMATVAPFINGKGWEYEVYLDPNSDLKRAMNVNMVPQTFVLNGKKEIVKHHSSYTPGSEEKLIEEVRKLIAEESKKSSN